MCRLRVAPRDGEPQAAKFAGGHRIRVTPVPIPNTEVKPDTADGTVWETVWESRSLPALFLEPANFGSRAFFMLEPTRLPRASLRRGPAIQSGARIGAVRLAPRREVEGQAAN